MTQGWDQWHIKKDGQFDIQEGILSTPGFENLQFYGRNDSFCQNVIMSREIRYNQNSQNSL